MEIIKQGTQINFHRFRGAALFVSVSLFIFSLIGVFVWPGPNWGIDFAGGAEVQVRLDRHLDEGGIAELRGAMEELDLGEVKVQEWLELGQETSRKYMIRLKSLGFERKTFQERGEERGSEDEEGEEEESEASPVEDKLAELYGDHGYEILKTDYVGPRVGEDLRNKGILAIVYAIALILVYITLRFEFRYALGAVIALIHDVTITTGAFMWSGKEVNLAIIAALLTIVGYSLNDTIVVFDRIRENVRRMRRLPFAQMIDNSINETLSRTLLTSLTTLVVVFFLWLLGGGVIHDFAFALMVGVVVGTYSSIFVASSFVIFWEKVRAGKRTPVAAEK